MALLYRCDICGKEVEPGDTYGPGVVADPKAGRPYVWYQEVAGGLRKLGISVQPFCEGTDNQVCGECVGDALKEMVAELWPEPSPKVMEYPEDFANYPGPFHEGPPAEWRGELPMKFQRDEARQELGLDPWEDEEPPPAGFRPHVQDFEDKLAHAAHNPEIIKVDLPPGIPDGALLRVNHPDRSKSTTACGIQCEPTHCHYTDNGECYHVEQQRERTSANPNGADREDRHLHAVRPVEPVPDTGPAERPEPTVLADRFPAIRPELGLPTPTHCPDCGGPLPDQHQQWCQYFK